MASKKFFVDIDLQGNDLNNSTVGANANMTKAGSFQYDSSANRLQYYNGATIETIANLNDLTGGLDFQGAYDAATNDPNLTTPAAGAIFKGYYWVVTVAGTFFGEALAVGDSLFANVNDPASLADWTLVQGNVVLATETVDGIVRLATQAEVNTGTETGAYAVTPATLQGKINDQSFFGFIDVTTGWTLVGDVYRATIVHNLNSFITNVTSWYTIGNVVIEFGYESADQNTLHVYSNTIPGDNVNVAISRITPYGV